MDSFLMIGQSNMAGRGFPDEVPPIKSDHLFMLRNGRWQPLCEPVNYDRPFSGIGPAPEFARLYQESTGRDTGLIPCADGGTSLCDWKPGGLLYDHAVFQAKLAMRTSELKGILWHQGETDSDEEESAQRYFERLSVFFDRLLSDLGLTGLPVLIGEIGYYLGSYPLGGDYFQIVNTAIRSFCDSHDRFGLVSAEGLEPNPDGLHFSAASQRIFGKRYYEAYERLTNQRRG